MLDRVRSVRCSLVYDGSLQFAAGGQSSTSTAAGVGATGRDSDADRAGRLLEQEWCECVTRAQVGTQGAGGRSGLGRYSPSLAGANGTN